MTKLLKADCHFARGHFQMHLAFQLGPGITGLWGPSGAGKTTILNLLAGVLKPQKGSIYWGRQALCDIPKKHWQPPAQRGIGVAFQEPRLFPHMTVAQNLKFGYKPAPEPNPAPPNHLAEIAQILEISPHLQQKAGTLSGGQAQRVALGRALLSQPQILLLDEPLSGMDPARKQRILPKLRRQLKQMETPTLIVHHQLTELLQFTPNLMLMDTNTTRGPYSYQAWLRDPWARTQFAAGGLPNVIHCRTKSHHPTAGTTQIEPIQAPQLALTTPLNQTQPNQEIAYQLRPETITLSQAPQTGTSAQNQIKGQIRTLWEQPDAVWVQIDSGIPLIAEITRKTKTDLNLEEGTPVWAIFKAQALRKLEG